MVTCSGGMGSFVRKRDMEGTGRGKGGVGRFHTLRIAIGLADSQKGLSNGAKDENSKGT